MSNVRILLAEDNPLHASKLEMLIDMLDYQLVGIGSTEEEVKELYQKHSPDLVVLDISLAGKGDGIKLARDLQVIRPTPIIFLTSHEDKQTLQRALNSNPHAYLIKPVEKPSLQAAIELALFKSNQSSEEKVAQPTSDLEEQIINDSFLIKAGSKLTKVPLEDILWIEVSQDRYCDIVTEKRNYPIRTSMNLLESRLDTSVFVRIHRSHIVNIHRIHEIDEFEMTVEMGGKSLPLGGSYKANLLDRFKLL